MNELMKKSKRIHHFLIALFPILIIYSQNIGRIEIEDIFLTVVLILGSSIGLYYFFKFILKNENKAAIITSIILVLVFIYGHVYYLLNHVSMVDFDIGKTRYLVPIFISLTGIGIFLTIKTKRQLNNATSILNVISIVLVLFSFANIALMITEITSCEGCEANLFYKQIDLSSHFESKKLSIPNNPPDVYYIILDEYPRNDVLQEYHDFDNSKFINSLRQRGFNVAENNHANYPLSVQSIPATMNMNYINFLTTEIGSEVTNLEPVEGVDGLYLNNQVIKNFKSIGYKIINFNTLALVNHKNPLADLTPCHGEQTILVNRLFDTIARTTIFGYYVERLAENEMRETILCTFDELSNVGEKFREPTFVWAHILLPHPPYIFGPNGESVTPGKPLLLTANVEYRDSGWEPKNQFVEQIEFANKRTVKIVDDILAKEKPAIIIIQGDHGTGWDINWKEPSKEDVAERLRNFDAIYFPDEEKRTALDDDRTLVNTFRIVFNSYYGTNYEILENKFYWGWNDKPYVFKDVTDFLSNSK